MKRAFVGALVFALAGCGGEAAPPAKSPADTQAPASADSSTDASDASSPSTEPKAAGADDAWAGESEAKAPAEPAPGVRGGGPQNRERQVMRSAGQREESNRCFR